MSRRAIGVFVTLLLSLAAVVPSFAIDFTTLASMGGPLGTALSTLAGMETGVKAIIGFIGFVVALISLAALRNLSPVLFFVGLAIFGGVGLAIAGAIMGVDVGTLASM
ncbi:hypothetical protein GEV02_20825 [Rugamonas sp. FT29W]|uniref:Uncharacterized protein n=1 Tax=Rugamonas aquatica TaxID=2743357 RepID=A0A6A7N6C5_9BURK|nr:hypothetical protein [Rugamonas aquatica]